MESDPTDPNELSNYDSEDVKRVFPGNETKGDQVKTDVEHLEHPLLKQIASTLTRYPYIDTWTVQFDHMSHSVEIRIRLFVEQAEDPKRTPNRSPQSRK